jgi:hypothetical protein
MSKKESKESKRARTSPGQEPKPKKSTPVQREAATKKLNVEMNEQTLRQLLNEFSERNEAARKEDRAVTTFNNFLNEIKLPAKRTVTTFDRGLTELL